MGKSTLTVFPIRISMERQDILQSIRVVKTGRCVFMSSKRGWEVPDVQPGEGYAGRYPQGGTGQTGRPGKEGIKLPLAVRAQHDACFRLRGSASVVK
jgi:hypothetical protein